MQASSVARLQRMQAKLIAELDLAQGEVYRLDNDNSALRSSLAQQERSAKHWEEQS